MVHRFPDGWRLLPLEDCMEAIIDYRGKTPKKTAFGIPLITAKVVKGGRILDEPREYISYDDYESWMRRGIPKPGDVVMTTEAPLGEVAQLDERKVALAQRLITLRGKPGLLDSNYLKFLMQSRFVQHELEARATGTTVIGIRQRELRKVRLIVPPLAEQQAIAHVLGSLDAKIELNHQMNQTLEAIARAIFKSWFVDFDPVWAKIDGDELHGIDAETAALFPDAFVDSALGPIPEGWRVGTLRDCCKRVENGGTPRRSEPEFWEPRAIPWLTSGEVRQSIVISTENFISEQGLANSSAKLWPSGTTIVAMYGATAGQVCLLARQMCANQACCGLIPAENAQWYIYLHASRSVELLGRQARGSAQQNLSQKIVAGFPTVIPDSAAVVSFHRAVQPLFEKWIANLHESCTLAELRDTLFPKLISGQLRIRDTESFAEGVV